MATLIAPATASAAAHGTFTLIASKSPASFDPAQNPETTQINNCCGMQAVYGSLLYADLTSPTLTPRMQLARSLSGTDHARLWTLVLLPHIKFTDGTPFDAAAVKFNWQRDATLPIALAAVRASAAQIAALRVVNATTLRITLTAGNADFAFDVEQNLGAIASPAALQQFGSSYGTSPSTTVGAGPFILQTWTVGSQATFTRNPHFAIPGEPKVQNLVNIWSSVDTTRFSAVEVGEAEMTYSPTDYQYFQLAPPAGLKVRRLPSFANYMWPINVRPGRPFSDPRARLALNIAIDPNQMNQIFFNGYAKANNNLMAPKNFWNVPQAKLPAYNHAEAQQLFDAVAATRGGTFEFSVVGSTNATLELQNFQALLSSYQHVKVDVVIVGNSINAYQAGTYDLDTFDSPGPVKPNPIAGMEQFLRTNGPQSYTGANDPEADNLIAAGLATESQVQRLAIWKKLAKLVVSQNYFFVEPVLPPPTPIIYNSTVATMSNGFTGLNLATVTVK